MKEKVTRNKTNKHSLTNSRLISRNCQKKIVHSSALQRLFLGNREALQAFPLDVTALTVLGTCHRSGDFSKPKTTSRGCRSAFVRFAWRRACHVLTQVSLGRHLRNVGWSHLLQFRGHVGYATETRTTCRVSQFWGRIQQLIIRLTI